MDKTSREVVLFEPPADVEVDEITKTFWDRVREGRLSVQRCSGCRAYRTPPTLYCPECLSTASEWPELSGKGEIYTYIVVPADRKRPDGDAFVPALVCPDETGDLKLFCGIVNCDVEELRVGLKVELVSAPMGEDRLLFQPARSGKAEER